MKVNELEGWIGCDVYDAAGDKVGKLEEVYFAGATPALASVRSGRLSKKHHLVPLDGAAVTHDDLQLAFAGDRLLVAGDGEAAPTSSELDQVTETYGVGRAVAAGESVEGSRARAARLEAEDEARRRAEEAERAAEERAREADEAAARADEADRVARDADEARRRAAEDAARARGDAPA